MRRLVVVVLSTSVLSSVPALSEPVSLNPDHYYRPSRTVPAYVAPQQAAPAPMAVETAPPVRYASADGGSNLGGGFIEFLFGGGHVAPPRPQMELPRHASLGHPHEAMIRAEPDPKFLRQVVRYSGPEKPGTIIIDTPQRFLFLVQEDGTAIRYGIGVGRPGFTWAGVKSVSAKKEWPDWVPPPEMLQRQPDLPHFMAGGPGNPLGARALYLGSSLYRIHGSNEPWTIGQAVSSGCIRLRNEDVIDLYERVKLGTKVVVI
jgi:lipoprotein-anchoring transpeptidase ErfK/SrfK